MTLEYLIENVIPRYPEAAELIASSTSEHDLDPKEWNILRLEPLHVALPRFFEVILFQPWMDGIEAEVDPRTDTDEELRGYYTERKQRNHVALQQLEAALHEVGVEATIDQPLGLGEYCIDQGIAKQGPNGNLIFSE